jgi:hypothetical protein
MSSCLMRKIQSVCHCSFLSSPDQSFRSLVSKAAKRSLLDESGLSISIGVGSYERARHRERVDCRRSPSPCWSQCSPPSQPDIHSLELGRVPRVVAITPSRACTNRHNIRDCVERLHPMSQIKFSRFIEKEQKKCTTLSFRRF